MVTADTVRTVVGVIGNLTSGFLFLSTVPTFLSIWKKKSVEQYSPIPYLATFVNCGLWTLYGMPWVQPNNWLVVSINGSGFLLETVYLLLFLVFSDPKKRLQVFVIMIVEIVFLVALGTVVSTVVYSLKQRATIIGSLAVAGNILMYAAPLSVMKLVITTKSVEYMPFLLSLFSFLNGLAWTFYGLIKFNPFIVVPNSIGTFFGIVQLILYGAFYKATKRQIAERKAKAEMGLTDISTSGISGKINNGP